MIAKETFRGYKTEIIKKFQEELSHKEDELFFYALCNCPAFGHCFEGRGDCRWCDARKLCKKFEKFTKH